MSKRQKTLIHNPDEHLNSDFDEEEYIFNGSERKPEDVIYVIGDEGSEGSDCEESEEEQFVRRTVYIPDHRLILTNLTVI